MRSPPPPAPPGRPLLASAIHLPQAAGLGGWFTPFGLDAPSLAPLVRDTTTTGRVAERADQDRRAFPGAAEPVAGLFRARADDEALVCLVAPAEGGGLRCEAAWPLLPPGRSHRVGVERLVLSPDRLLGSVQGVLECGLRLTWFDPFFVLHRCSYASGDVARIALAGLARTCGRARPLPPVRIAPETPLLASLGDGGAIRLAPDGGIELSRDDAVAILPAGTGPPFAFDIRGLLERAPQPRDRPLLGRTVHTLVVCVCTGEDDVLLDVVVTDLASAPGPPLREGEMIEANVLLQGRVLSHREPPSDGGRDARARG